MSESLLPENNPPPKKKRSIATLDEPVYKTLVCIYLLLVINIAHF